MPKNRLVTISFTYFDYDIKVSTYVPWIDCIVKMALHPKKYTHGQITEYCKERFEIEN